MKRFLLAVVLLTLVVASSEAGFLRKGRRGGCANGQCGPAVQTASFQAAPAPTTLNAPTLGQSLNNTASQCGPRGCDR